MTTPDPRLESLYARLEEVLGNPYANTLMTYLPPEPASRAITKDDLAALGARMDSRFDRVDQRFEQVDRRFEQVDQRFEQVDQRFEQVDQRFDQVDQRFDQVERRLAQVEHRMERADERFDRVEDRFHLIRDDLRDQMKTYTLTTVGAMTALTAIYAGLLAVIA